MPTSATRPRDPPQPAPAKAVLVLEDFLPYRLSVLANRASDTLARAYSLRFALGVNEWRVMAVLGHHPDLSANAVARRTAMDKVAVSRAVSRLLDSGRVQRRFDPSDRRRSLLRLSRTGQAVYAQVVKIALDFEQQLLGDVDAAERGQLFRLLDRLDELELRAGTPAAEAAD